MNEFEQVVEVKGHIIDSLILTNILDKILEMEGDFEVLDFEIGKRRVDPSHARLLVKGTSEEHLRRILHELHRLGAAFPKPRAVAHMPAPADMVLPEDFYSTSNDQTLIYLNARWIKVEDPMMDKAIVVEPKANTATCRAIRDVKKGDLVVVGDEGIMVLPSRRSGKRPEIFEFMSSAASSEKPIRPIVRRIAREILETKKSGGKIVVVAGPAVVHAGAATAMVALVRNGYVDALLSGNALAVHDVEHALYGTSLGIRIADGTPAFRGYRNHMAAINTVFRSGSLEEAVKTGVLRSGIIHECLVNNVPYVLAGSIRDDGPIPDVVTDVVEAQRRYKEVLKGAGLVLMLATMLHSIAVGNMLPSDVQVVCVDINPLAVTKLLDRGTTQATGLISDVGTFLPWLVAELEGLKPIRDAS